MQAPEAGRIAALARRIGLAPTPAQLQQLQDYLGLLQRWNGTYNLTALRDPAQMFSLHLADCLAILPALQRWVQGQGGRPDLKLLDVGSGGGLPGVVIAILCPEIRVCCVDTVGKKAAFIRQVSVELRLPNLRAEHQRVENLRDGFDMITSRAFASLADFTGLTRQLLGPGGVWMAMKGKRPDDELSALPPDIDVFHVEPVQVPDLEAERCLVWLRPRT